VCGGQASGPTITTPVSASQTRIVWSSKPETKYTGFHEYSKWRNTGGSTPVKASCTVSELMDDAEQLNIKAMLMTRNAEDRLEFQNLSKKTGSGCHIYSCSTFAEDLFNMPVLGETHNLPINEEPRKPSPLHGLYNRSLQIFRADWERKVILCDRQ
jgi:hypothetical protein